MNDTRPPRPAVPRSVEERDWLAQERALAHPAGDRRDALLARALRTMPVSQPPADFAAAVAALAASGATVASREPDAKLERMLFNGLLAVFALAVVVVAAMYGGQWWAMASEGLGRGAAQWALAAGACLLLSWLPGGARRLYEATRVVQAA